MKDLKDRSDILTVAVDAELAGRPDLAKELRQQADVLDPTTPLEEILGKIMRAVTQNGHETIDFEAVTGERWQMYYSPDCCATCSIEDVVGDLQDLVGAPILMAEESTNSSDPASTHDESPDSYTWTQACHHKGICDHPVVWIEQRLL